MKNIIKKTLFSVGDSIRFSKEYIKDNNQFFEDSNSKNGIVFIIEILENAMPDIGDMKNWENICLTTLTNNIVIEGRLYRPFLKEKSLIENCKHCRVVLTEKTIQSFYNHGAYEEVDEHEINNEQQQ